MPLNMIKQTSKILLVEEFCLTDPQDPNRLAPRLDDLLRNEDVRVTSNFLKLMEEKLEVRTYQEFVERFMPTVWEWIETSGEPGVPFRYGCSLEKPDHIADEYVHPMRLDKNEFYKMVTNLYDRKNAAGKANVDFDYSVVEELLSPKQVLANAKEMRRDLQYNFQKLQELPETAKADCHACNRRIKTLRKEIISQYKDSPLGMIKLALADTEQKLKALPAPQPNGLLPEAAVQALPCSIRFNDDGELDVQVLEPESRQAALTGGSAAALTAGTENQLALRIGKDFDKICGGENQYLKALVISNYCGDSSLSPVLDREVLLQNYQQYMSLYQQSQEQFIRAISTAVEKMLDVRIFFEQATTNGVSLRAPVIVANCTASQLMRSEQTKKDFTYLISHNQEEKTGNHIWFALIPAIGDEDFLDNVVDDDEDWDSDLDDEEETIQTADGGTYVPFEVLQEMLQILSEGKIMTFFNYRANEETGFEKLSAERIRKYKDKLSGVRNPYAVFCYPNFTILPRKNACIAIGHRDPDRKEGLEMLDLPGIYVDAAYVAAGLVVGTQNPDYLKKKGFEVRPSNPCVHFNLEDGNNRFRLQTTLNREDLAAWSTEVVNAIGGEMFGFSFCGNDLVYNGAPVRNTYVYTARSLNREGDTYEPIYKRLTMDFITQFLKLHCMTVGGSNQVKKTDYDKFMMKYVTDEWEPENNQTYVNRILYAGDVISENEQNKMAIRFDKSGEQTIDIEIE